MCVSSRRPSAARGSLLRSSSNMEPTCLPSKLIYPFEKGKGKTTLKKCGFQARVGVRVGAGVTYRKVSVRFARRCLGCDAGAAASIDAWKCPMYHGSEN